MRFNGLRKYYFEKRLKERETQFCSDIKINRLSIRQNAQSDIKKSAFNHQKSSKKNNLNFNGQNELNIKKNLFLNKNDKENYCPNESNNENKASKDTQENTTKNNGNIIYNSNNNSRNNYFNNRKIGRYNRFKLRLSMPIYIDNNYNTSNGEIKKDIVNNNSIYNSSIYNNITFDCEIDDLINSTTSKIEKEKEQKIKNNSEFQKYLQKVKAERLSKNNLTKGSLAIIQMEASHAKEAILNNKYISYTNKINIDKKNNNNNICFHLGKNSMCVCGHVFFWHNLVLFEGEFKSNCKKCKCGKLKYIPIFPEETNDYAKAYLLDFKYEDWKAGCKCGHYWTEHNFIDGGKCEECKCEIFESNFTCGVCGESWEDHIILIQTQEEREKNRESTGNNYEPFTQEQIGKLLNY